MTAALVLITKPQVSESLSRNTHWPIKSSLAEESLECGFPQRASAKAISDAQLATDNNDYRDKRVRLVKGI